MKALTVIIEKTENNYSAYLAEVDGIVATGHNIDEIKANNGYQLSVDLVNRVVIEPNGKRHEFEVPEFRRYCLLNGLDDIGITLQHADEIKAFEQQRLNQKPWLAKTIY